MPPWLRFALLCTLFMMLSIWLEPYLAPLCRVTADQVTTLLCLSGLAPRQQGELITLSGFTVRIVTECTPLYACLLYCSFVLAQPAHLVRTMIGLLAGVLLISTVNLVRIAAVTAVGPHVSSSSSISCMSTWDRLPCCCW
jgi:exosortase/archaeosortase family protein